MFNVYVQILQFLRTFRAQVPVRNPGTGRYIINFMYYLSLIFYSEYGPYEFLSMSDRRRSVGGLYYLSYLDRNMLLGRAVGGGGVFVFTKAQPLEL